MIDQSVLESMKRSLLIESQGALGLTTIAGEFEVKSLLRYCAHRDVNSESEAAVKKSAFERKVEQQRELLHRLKLDNLDRKTAALDGVDKGGTAVVQVRDPKTGLSTSHRFTGSAMSMSPTRRTEKRPEAASVTMPSMRRFGAPGGPSVTGVRVDARLPKTDYMCASIDPQAEADDRSFRFLGTRKADDMDMGSELLESIDPSQASQQPTETLTRNTNEQGKSGPTLAKRMQLPKNRAITPDMTRPNQRRNINNFIGH
jgi:hypothetical protein